MVATATVAHFATRQPHSNSRMCAEEKGRLRGVASAGWLRAAEQDRVDVAEARPALTNRMPPRVDLDRYGLQHASVLGRQLDLFSGRGFPGSDEVAARVEPARLVPSGLDDATLVAVLPEARLANCRALCEEAGRRRLTAAVPALEALCQRFKGFGVEHAVPEQIAALHGLVAIRTHEAGVAV